MSPRSGEQSGREPARGREGKKEKKGGGGGAEKEVISGLFLPAICQPPPPEIFRGETNTGGFLNFHRVRDRRTCLATHLTLC